MSRYINYYFKNLKHQNSIISGSFESPDVDIYCDFIFYTDDMTIDIFNNNKPVEEILPLPVHWLIMKLEKNGKLNENESKISY